MVDVLALHGVEAAEYDGLDLFVSREWRGGGLRAVGYSVAHVRLVDGFDACADEADLSRAEPFYLHHVWLEYADLVDLVIAPCRHEADVFPRLQRAVHHAHIADDALIVVVDGVEDQRLQRSAGLAGGRRHVAHDPFQQLGDTLAGLGGDWNRVVGVDSDDLFQLALHLFGVGRRQVYLV